MVATAMIGVAVRKPSLGRNGVVDMIGRDGIVRARRALSGQEIGQNVGLIQSSTRSAVDAVREIGGAVHEINAITSTIAGAVEEQNAATREISANAQSAAQGNETLVTNIDSLKEAIGETSTAAASVLATSDDLSTTAETLSREVEKFFHNLRSGPAEEQKVA